MIYIVTGLQRSGTSMMMRALREGGLPIYYDKANEERLRSSYNPEEFNKSGYWEPDKGELDQLDFPLKAKGKAIKFHSPHKILGSLYPHEYHIVMMTRDPREILLSMARMNRGIVTTADVELLNDFQSYYNKAQALAENRRDVLSFTTLKYQDVLKRPELAFRKLKQAGWPINPKRAASVVDPAQRHAKIDTPFTGDIAKEFGLEPKSIREAILDGDMPATPEMLQAAKDGKEFRVEVR